MECLTQSVRKLGVADRLRDGQVDGTCDYGLPDDEIDDGADFVERNPAHHLVAGTKLAAKTKSEKGQHSLERSPIRGQHNADAQFDDADTRFLGNGS